ncbi:MAG: fructose-bisphosphatase class II family protein [Sedimentisphaerales bacterium]|nr:fructose-bisphosphatase class II family protein [Sedimentisphaerales bacterium]
MSKAKKKQTVKKTKAARPAAPKGKAKPAAKEHDGDGGHAEFWTEKVKVSPTDLDLERMVELDFLRTTEAAALNAYRWLGKGDPQGAHAAAVDAMRGTLGLTCIRGNVVVGDGLKPQPGPIETGEQLGIGRKGSFEADLAVLPIDGVDLVSLGYPGAMSLLAAAHHNKDVPAFLDVPCRYMEKIAYGPAVRKGPAQVHLNASVRDNLEIIALQLNKRVQDLQVIVLDRKRHEKLVANVRKTGASVRLIREGDVAGCIAAALPDTGVDVYMGTGGAAEAVLGSAAIKCLGGDMLSRLAPTSDEEKERIVAALGDQALTRHFTAEDLVRGDSVVFCATGITSSFVLRGIHIEKAVASTYSVVMRARYGTVRYIRAEHDLGRKTIRLHSAGAEAML